MHNNCISVLKNKRRRRDYLNEPEYYYKQIVKIQADRLVLVLSQFAFADFLYNCRRFYTFNDPFLYFHASFLQKKRLREMR